MGATSKVTTGGRWESSRRSSPCRLGVRGSWPARARRSRCRVAKAGMLVAVTDHALVGHDRIADMDVDEVIDRGHEHILWGLTQQGHVREVLGQAKVGHLLLTRGHLGGQRRGRSRRALLDGIVELLQRARPGRHRRPLCDALHSSTHDSTRASMAAGTSASFSSLGPLRRPLSGRPAHRRRRWNALTSSTAARRAAASRSFTRACPQERRLRARRASACWWRLSPAEARHDLRMLAASHLEHIEKSSSAICLAVARIISGIVVVGRSATP